LSLVLVISHASILNRAKPIADYQQVTNLNPSSSPPHSPASSAAPSSPGSASLTIATRESRLALWQAEHVQALLAQSGHTVQLLGMTTRGDQILDRSLSKVGGKGLFVKELETALEDGRADLAVHSLKDVPMDLPEGFSLACVMAREDPRDAFVSNQYASLAELPQGAVVGTSSLRRTVLLRALRPDLRIEPLRGNLDTRLRKLDDGHYAAIVLAAAGLKRLGLASRIASVFETDVMLPAAGQGALGIEIRSDRLDLVAALAQLADQPTWLAVAAERAVSRAMGGSCSMPLAAHAVWRHGKPRESGESAAPVLEIRAAWGEPEPDDGVASPQPLVRAHLAGPVSDLHQAAALGEQVAALLVAGGARSLRRVD
jgi:hydroxymethylbilane synthase